MQKGKGLQYAAAGVQAMPGIRMNVRSTVRVPDAEAGRDFDSARRPFDGGGETPIPPRQSVTIPAHIGALFLCLVFVIFGCLVVNKACCRADLSRRISAMEEDITKVMRENSQLAVDVMQARESSDICFTAIQKLGMVSSSGVETVPVVAPDTRPFRAAGGQTENSPFSAGLGNISGSR